MRHKLPTANEPIPPEYVQLLARIEQLATALDSRYPVPWTSVRFGWDPIVGLIPVAGDIAMAAVGARLVGYAWQLGARGPVIARMSANVMVDLLLGAIPFVGPLFDLFFRSNMRNLDLLLAEIQRSRTLQAPAPAAGRRI